MTQAPVIVIGSGISGLTAAALLSEMGHDTLILEQNRTSGGVTQRFQRQSIDFDVGFHYTGGLGPGEALRRLWDRLGVLEHLDILPFPEQAADCVRITGSDITARAYFSYPAIQEELQRLFPDETDGIHTVLDTIRSAGESIPFYNMQSNLKPFLQSLSFPEKLTLGNLLRRHIRSRELQAILSLPTFLHGVSPDRIGITMHASVAHSVYSGMYTVDGGGRAIIRGFSETLSRRGVPIHTNSKVRRIIVRDGKVCAVRTDDQELAASAVIYTGHPSTVQELVPDAGFRKAYVNRLEQLLNTPSMVVIFGVIDRHHADRESTWNNYYQIPPDLEFIHRNDYSNNSCFFLSGCGLRDSGDNGGQSGNRAATLIRPARWEEVSGFDRGRKKRSTDYRNWKQRARDSLIEEAGKAYPETMQNFVPITTSSPLTFRDELDYPQGSVYGVQHSTEQFMIGSRTHLPGLWLSGQSILMPGILGASLSALVTVGNMTDLENLWQEVRQ